jgi:hypothetical protein
VLALSKSSKRRQASRSNDESAGTEGNRTILIIAGIVIVIALFGAAIWLYLTPNANGSVTPNSIVGTWTDKNNYYAYAYYSNGSIQELGWITLAGSGTHEPVSTAGTWNTLGNNYYLINPDITHNTTYEALINGTTMNVLNVSNGGVTYKISDVPNVYQVKFNYVH